MSYFDRLIEIKAENAFRDKCRELLGNVKPEDLVYLAKNNISIISIMPKKYAEVFSRGALTSMNTSTKVGVDYLLSLSEDKLIEIMSRSVPKQAAVLRAYPRYASSVLKEFQQLVKNAMEAQLALPGR
jgi:hypothetical protein